MKVDLIESEKRKKTSFFVLGNLDWEINPPGLF